MGFMRGHMLPKSYIEAWADKKNTVDVIDLQDGRGFPSSIRTATAVTDVYDAEVLTNNLEKIYSKIEDAGSRVLVKLRNGDQALTKAEREAMIAFLDMHLDRGRYADRAKVRAPALIVKTNGEIEEAELRLGDALTLSQSLPDLLRLRALGLGLWEWSVWTVTGLITGDGAVVLSRSAQDTSISTVFFPLSPTKLLVIGHKFPPEVPINDWIVSNSKRWIVGTRGSLDLHSADKENAGAQPPSASP